MPQNVGNETRQIVLDSVEKLNYRPNTVARSLRKNNTHTIGIVTNSLSKGGRFVMPMMMGVDLGARQAGFSILLSNSYGDIRQEKSALGVLLDKQIDGIILMGGTIHGRGAPALDLGDIPVVYLYQYTNDLQVPCVIPDDYQGGKIGTTHLVQKGHERIALINGPLSFEVTLERLQGYQDALSEAGLPIDRTLIHSANSWHQDEGFRVANEILSMPDAPTALFCASDTLAEGAMDAICRHGLTIPDDIALVGFDNDDSSQYRNPPLTTVALPLAAMGQLAAELLISMSRHEVYKSQIHKVPCSLIERQSCGDTLTTK